MCQAGHGAWFWVKPEPCVEVEAFRLLLLLLLITLVVSDSLRPHGLQPARLLCPWESPGKSTGVGCRALLQGIFPTRGLNLGLLCLLHCRQILYRWAIREAQ